MTKPPPSGVADVAAWDDLQQLDENGDNLTPWEIEFVESLTKQLKAGRWASPKQSETLHDIMAKRIR